MFAESVYPVLKALTCFVAALVGASLFVLMLQISSAVKHADDAVNGVAARLDGVIEQAGKTVLLSDELIGDSRKLINDARLSADNLNSAALDERFYFEKRLPGLIDQAGDVLANVQTATADLHPLVTETTARVRELAVLEVNATELVADADVTARDPHIAESLANLSSSTAELAVTSRESAAAMGSVQAIAKDGQDEVHKLTHPKPLVTIADWTLKVVHALGGFF